MKFYCRIDKIVNGVKAAKSVEIAAGVDGFMIYDLRMVDAINDLWDWKCPTENQLQCLPDVDHVTGFSLIKIPEGGVTLDGLK